MATVKFLTGTETDLLKRVGGASDGAYVNPIVEGSLYVTAEPDAIGTWHSSIYYDTQGRRIKISGGGGDGGNVNSGLFVHKIVYDGLSSSNTTVITTLRNVNGTDIFNINFPAASDLSAGVITTGTQTITGDKTFDDKGSLTIQKSKGFNYSGISEGTDDVERTVWFSHANSPGIPVRNSAFRINPTAKDNWNTILTNTLDKTGVSTGYSKLVVDVVQGIAAEAYADDQGNRISKKYVNKIEFDGSSGTNVKYTTYDGTNTAIQNAVDFPNASGSTAGVVTTGAQTIAGDKTFTGRVYINNNHDAVTGTADTGTLIIGDKTAEHIAIDNNEIMAKSNATTAGTLYLQNEGGKVLIGGALDVIEATTLKNTLEVAEGAQLKKTLTVEGINYFNNATAATGKNTGAVQVKGGISVNGASYFDAAVIFNGGLTMNDNLTVKKNVNIDGTLTVGGATTLKDTLEVQKKATLKDALEVIGATILKSTLGVDGATTLNSTLGVKGKATLSDELDVVKGALFQSDINVQGIGKFNKNEPADNTGNTGSVRVTGGIYVGNTSYFKGDVTFGKAVEIIGATTLTGGVKGDLIMLTGDSSIYWNDNGVYRQRIKTYDTSATNDAVFKFQESTNSGSSFTDLLTIRDNGVIVLTKNIGRLTKLYDAASTVPAITVGSSDKDVTVLKMGHSSNGDTVDTGFAFKYMGTGSGVNNKFEIYADGYQTGASTDKGENLSLSINQISEIGLGAAPSSGFRLYVNGKTSITGSEAATNESTGTLRVTGGILATLDSYFKANVIVNGSLTVNDVIIGKKMATFESGLRVGNSATGDTNYIAFYGVTGDGPGNFNHTYIGENLYNNATSDYSELVIFKGNDAGTITNTAAGPDRIRHIAAGHLFQTYESALSGTWTAVCDSTLPKTRFEIFAKGVRVHQNIYFGTLNDNSYVNDAGVGYLTQLGIGLGTATNSLSSYLLYVNGNSYYNGGLYFTSDKYYHIDNVANAKFRNIVVGADDTNTIKPTTSGYSFYSVGNALVNGDFYILKQHGSIIWNQGDYYQRIGITDDSTAGKNTFMFQDSKDKGVTWRDILVLRNDKVVVLTNNEGRLTKLYTATNTIPAISIGANKVNINAIRIGYSTNGNSFSTGYTVKYLGGISEEVNRRLELYADNLGGDTNVKEQLAISVNQSSEIGFGAEPQTGFRIYSNGRVKIASGQAAVTNETVTNYDKQGALQITGGIRASADSHFGGWINTIYGYGINSVEGDGRGISLYGRSTSSSTTNPTYGGTTPKYGIFVGKTATFGKFGGVTAAIATYFNVGDNADGEGWIFRRIVSGSTAGVHNIVAIDNKGSIHSYWNKAEAVTHKVQNSLATTGIYAAASGNRGLYDFTRDVWLIYTRDSDDTTRTPQPLYIDNTLHTQHIYPQKANTYDLGSTSMYWKNAYSNNFRVMDTSGTQVGLFAGNTTVAAGAQGYGDLYLGNSATTSVAANARGRLIIYGTGAYYSLFQANAGSSHKTVTIPNYTGYMTISHGSVYNVTSRTGYKIPFYMNDCQRLGCNDGILYYTLEGTASDLGYGDLVLGNSVASGTAGNKRGRFYLYGEKAAYTLLQTNATGDRTVTIPDYAGYMTISQNGATNPTSASTYYVPFYNVNYQRLSDNNGLRYLTLEGTTSAVGYGWLILGNNTAKGSAGNKYGGFRLFNQSSGYIDISPGTTTTTNYTLYLPGATGQLVYHTNDTAIGSTSIPVYITSGGQATPVGTIASGNGGTGVSSHTANRLVWSTSATTIQATNNHYAAADRIGINYTGNSGYNFYVNGTSGFGNLITANYGSSHRGIRLGDTYINAINGDVIFQNNNAIRFGGDSWDWNVWAGLKYNPSNKYIYLGLADGSVFSANSAQSGGRILTPGISYFHVGNQTSYYFASGGNIYGHEIYSDSWFRSYNTCGWYNETYGCHVRAHDGAYGSIRVHGNARNGYEGIHIGTGTNGLTIMSVPGSHQGLYTQSNGRWTIYHNAANGLISIGGSSVTSGYIATINGSAYVQGHLRATGEVQSTTPNGFRLSYGSTGVILRNDGSHFYFLVGSTGAGDNWNGLRPFYFNLSNGYVYGTRLYNAVWNDYAEYRASRENEPGRVVLEDEFGVCQRTVERLQPFAGVVSDTYGFCQGETKTAKTPLAVAGRVLVYTYQSRNKYKVGDCVCAAPNGTVDIMTREEIVNYPDRIVGTVSEIPNYSIWGSGNAKVNGRIWIKVK